MQLVQYHDLGKISYKDAWDYQTIVHQKLLHKKLKFSGKDHKRQLHHLMICEHNPVYTLGKSGSIDNLLWNNTELDEKGIEYYPINRGGDITYHGPGQLTVYPIFDLEMFYRDVHRYVRELEEVVIRLLRDFEIEGKRNESYTGVWVETEENIKKKVCAIGVHISKWVSLHGLALNVDTNLKNFKGIIPCGINEEGREVTSMSELLNKKIELEEVKRKLKSHFKDVFTLNFITHLQQV